MISEDSSRMEEPRSGRARLLRVGLAARESSGTLSKRQARLPLPVSSARYRYERAGAEAPPTLYMGQGGRSLTAIDWSSSVTDVVPQASPPGPGSLQTVRVRSAHPMSSANREFLRLEVRVAEK